MGTEPLGTGPVMPDFALAVRTLRCYMLMKTLGLGLKIASDAIDDLLQADEDLLPELQTLSHHVEEAANAAHRAMTFLETRVDVQFKGGDDADAD